MATDYDAPRVHPDDSATDSLEEVKAAAGTSTAQQRDEFTCLCSLLVRHRSQIVEPETCLDCA
jgi:hypothetical protein